MNINLLNNFYKFFKLTNIIFKYVFIYLYKISFFSKINIKNYKVKVIFNNIIYINKTIKSLLLRLYY